MKNIQFLCSVLLTSFAVHGMEVGTDIDAEKIIKDRFKIYLANRLVEYKKCVTGYVKGCSQQARSEMLDIPDRFARITNNRDLSFMSECLHKNVCDDEGNTFVHIAVKNNDLVMVEWLIKHMMHPFSMPNKAGKEPIDLCIDQLQPRVQEANKEEDKKDAYKIFTTLIAGYDKIHFNDNDQRKFLKKIVALQLEHVKHPSDLILSEDILKHFDGQNLPEIYQEVSDENGNTFAHILVRHHLATMLYKFIEKKHITFAKNKDLKSPLETAEEIFLEASSGLFDQCIENKDFNIPAIPKEDSNKRCCYYMLLNLQKKQENKPFSQCCKEHII